jgi:DNA-binding transcriptional MerR regulator
MNNRITTNTYTLALVQGASTGPSTYSLEQAAQLGGVHPERLRYYCQIGLLTRARTRAGMELSFDDDALYELRRLEHYRRNHGVSRRTLRVLSALWREIDHLQSELRVLRRN